MSFRTTASGGLAVALMTVVSLPAGLSAAQKAVEETPAPPAVMVTMQFIQVDDPIQGVSLQGGATVALGEAGSPPQVEADSIEIMTGEPKPPAPGDDEAPPAVVDLSQAEGMALGAHVISRETVLSVRGRALRFEQGKIVDDQDTTKMPPKDKAYKVLSTPQLRVLVGDTAEMTMGSTVPYLVQNEDGCLELRHTDDADEGISVRLRVEKADERHVTFENLQMKLSMVTGRQPIEGVPFDVGRPIIRAMEISTALSLSPDRTALITFPRIGKDSPLILATISARLVEK